MKSKLKILVIDDCSVCFHSNDYYDSKLNSIFQCEKLDREKKGKGIPN